MIKLKALLLTVLIGVAAVGLVYIFLTHTKLVLGLLMGALGLMGLIVLYSEVYEYLDQKQALKNSKWNDKK